MEMDAGNPQPIAAPARGQCCFHRASRLPVSAEALAAWHFRSGALQRLLPPWLSLEVLQEASPLANGATAVIRARLGPCTTSVTASHHGVVEGQQFVDVQERGPFRSWSHAHRFLTVDSHHAMLEDSIRFDPPFGALGRALSRRVIQRELARQFAFRHARTRDDLLRHSDDLTRFGPTRLRIGVTGASGLVGKQLCAFLTTGGHEVVRFVRGQPGDATERRWNPADVACGLSQESLRDLDAMVHLAGAPIAALRWTTRRKRAILESRVQGTKAIAHALARAAVGPKVLVCASAIGFYGHRGSEWVDERSAPGQGFLAEVTQAWESAADEARAARVRVVHVRVGIVLSSAGGALRAMLPAFRCGLGGRVGAGTQGFSWISLDDLLGAILFCLRHPAMEGPVNAVAPNALTQAEFARTLGRVLRRPTVAPLPSTIVRGVFGEMGNRLLLDGALVKPLVLEREGFRFTHASLESALRLELGRLHSDGLD